jgi:hypothetical protein
MIGNKRRHRRQSLERRAVLRTLDGEPLGACVVSDISVGGARVMLDSPTRLPDAFMLCLTEDGAVSRECKVVWQRDDVVGVEFRGASAAGGRPAGGFRFAG